MAMITVWPTSMETIPILFSAAVLVILKRGTATMALPQAHMPNFSELTRSPVSHFLRRHGMTEHKY